MEQDTKFRSKPTHVWSIYDKGGKTIQQQRHILFNKWCWGNWKATCKTIKLEYSLTPYAKINSKWIKDLNIRPDTIKLLEENIGRTLFDINHSNTFIGPPPRVMKIKAKVNKWDLIKLKSFCTAKETIKKTKKTTHRMGENICKWSNLRRINLQNIQAVHATQYQKQNQKQPIKKWANDLNWQFPKKELWMAKNTCRNTERC